MLRRGFLAGLTVLFSGCGSLAAGVGGGTDDDRQTVTPAPVPTDEPTPDLGRRRFASEGCPTFDHRTHQTICSHTQSVESSLRLVPDRAVARLRGDRLRDPLRFTLHWGGSGELSVFADSWYVFRATADGWRSVATATGRDPVRRIDAGERLYWLLDTVAHGDSERTQSAVASLSPGRYAFAVQTVGGRSGVYSECLAFFDVVAPSTDA